MRNELPAFLLERAVEYHTRKGIRTWCVCPFCIFKKMHLRYVQSIAKYRDMYDCSYSYGHRDWGPLRNEEILRDHYVLALERQKAQKQYIRDNLEMLKEQ